MSDNPRRPPRRPLMAAIIDQAHIDQAYRVASELFGPDASVPWWAWLALLVMIFGACSSRTGGDSRPPTKPAAKNSRPPKVEGA